MNSMNCEKGNELLAGWMDNQQTASGRAEMEAHLEGCAECRMQMEANRELWVSMGRVHVPQPSDKLQVRFDAMLDTYKQEEISRAPGVLWSLRQLFAVRPRFVWAYSLILVVAGAGIGYMLSRPALGLAAAGRSGVAGSAALAADSDKQELRTLSEQVREMREMVLLSLLENPSASERIRGVSYTSEIKNINKNVVDALLSTLNNDPNNNVRLMTLEALTHYADDPAVREGLVQSILHQESPLVQAALADVMLKLQEKKAVRPFEELLQQKDLNEMVRMKIQQTLTRLI